MGELTNDFKETESYLSDGDFFLRVKEQILKKQSSGRANTYVITGRIGFAIAN